MPSNDIHHIDELEIRVAKAADGWRVWVDGQDGNLFRAYRVKNLTLSGLSLDESGDAAP